MKNIFFAFAFLLLSNISLNAQTNLIGAEAYSVNLPANFKRTIGNNDLATVQWEHDNDEIYGYVLFENKDELKLANVNADLKSYADEALNDFNQNLNYKLIEAKQAKTEAGKDSEIRLISYYNEDLKVNIFLQINIYSSKNFIYKMINFGDENTFNANKNNIDLITKMIQISE